MAASAPSAAAADAPLDLSLFDETLSLTALRIPAKKTSAFNQRLKGTGYMFDRPRVKPVIDDPAGGGATKLVLLSEAAGGADLAGLPAELREFVLAEGAEPTPHVLRLGFENLNAEQALRRLLPAGMEVPSSFEQVGHVAHVNLRTEQLPYKSLVGRVLLEKNKPRIRSVVNKVESISNQFRVFPMELLAGEAGLRTEVRENEAVFELDFGEVYWNSRLGEEHKRIVSSVLRPSDVVADVFGGIGPFAVPAGLKGCHVYANDLNPDSFKWLNINVGRNKVGARVRTYNLDGRAFVRALLDPAPSPTPASQWAPPAALPFGFFGHVLMNLPASALSFLDVFVGAFDRAAWRAPLPTVHCYCFSKAEDPAADVIAVAEATMGCKLPGATATAVRDVSPHKLMMCLRFVLPEEAWAGGQPDDAADASPAFPQQPGGAARGKRQRVGEAGQQAESDSGEAERGPEREGSRSF